MQPDKIYMVKVSISGFTKTQVEDGLPSLLYEFGQRPWLFSTQALWEDSINKLVILVGYESEERLEDGAFDEISELCACKREF
jgi:hypothetical protein